MKLLFAALHESGFRIFFSCAKRRPFRDTADLDIADMAHLRDAKTIAAKCHGTMCCVVGIATSSH